MADTENETKEQTSISKETSTANEAAAAERQTPPASAPTDADTGAASSSVQANVSADASDGAASPSVQANALSDAAAPLSPHHRVKKTPHCKFVFHLPLLIAELVLLIAGAAVLAGVLRMTGTVEKVTIDQKNLVINTPVSYATQKRELGYRNIALFGVDARNGDLGAGTRSDTIMVMSINQDKGEISLVSVYRDTYLNLGDDTYNKCNAAYAKGGPEQAINMLNMNLDLDIMDYVTVGFAGLIDAIDKLGGVTIDVQEVEIQHLNNYQLTMADELGVDYVEVQRAGRQVLNGMQATAYCRIRYGGGDDYRRAQRQRTVLNAMLEQAKTVPVGDLTSAVSAVMPNVSTSLDINEMISLLSALSQYKVVTSEGFPFEDNRQAFVVGVKGDCVVPETLVDNVAQLHYLLFGEKEYLPSTQLLLYNTKIAEDTDQYRP